MSCTVRGLGERPAFVNLFEDVIGTSRLRRRWQLFRPGSASDVVEFRAAEIVAANSRISS